MASLMAERSRPDMAPCVYLDANVLIPEYLRSVFLDLAHARLIQVYWGSEVLVEVRRNLCSPKFGLSPAVVQRLLCTMGTAFPDALVVESNSLERRFVGKVDTNDLHVAAGVLKLLEELPSDRRVVLVTANLKHLPSSAFAGHGIDVMAPDAFLSAFTEQRPEVARVMSEMIARFKSPTVAKEVFLGTLDRLGCRAFASALAVLWGFEAA